MAWALYKSADLPLMRTAISKFVQEGSQNQTVRLYATSIVPNFTQDQVKAVYDNVQLHVKYQPDPAGTELFTAPWKMIELIQINNAAGDCDDIAILTASLLRTLGYQSRVALLGRFTPAYDHAVAQVYDEKIGDWLFVDPSNYTDPLGWVPPYVSIEYIS